MRSSVDRDFLPGDIVRLAPYYDLAYLDAWDIDPDAEYEVLTTYDWLGLVRLAGLRMLKSDPHYLSASNFVREPIFSCSELISCYVIVEEDPW